MLKVQTSLHVGKVDVADCWSHTYSVSLIIEYLVTMKRFGQTNNNPANEGGIWSAFDEDHHSRSTTMSCGLAWDNTNPKTERRVQENNHVINY